MEGRIQARRAGVVGNLRAPSTLGLGMLLGLAGCSMERPILASAQAGPQLPGHGSSVRRTALPSRPDGSGEPSYGVIQVVQAKAGPPITSRLQKPESEGARPNGIKPLLEIPKDTLPAAAEGRVAVRIRATVNGMPILDDEVREAAYPYLMATLSLPEPTRSAQQKEILQRELQRLIEREIILKDAMLLLSKRKTYLDKLTAAANREFEKQLRSLKDRSNTKTDEELKAALRAQGLSLEGIRRQITRSFMAAEYMRSRIFPEIERVGHEQIREYYDQHPGEFEVIDSVQWQDIFIDVSNYPSRSAAHAMAGQIIERARRGEDFRQLSAQYDNGDSSYRDGEGYGHQRGEIRPAEAEVYLFQMQDGELGPIIESSNGFHVIRLVSRQYAGRKPFDDKVQSAIRAKLQGDAWEREYKRIMTELKRNASIEISVGAP